MRSIIKDLIVVLEVLSTMHLLRLLICCLWFFLDFVEISLSKRSGEEGHSWIVVFEVYNGLLQILCSHIFVI